MISVVNRPSRPAVAYTRVSTQRQDEEGHGHDLQMTRIREFARLMGYTLVNTFSDAETGMGEESLRERKGVMEAIKFSKERRVPILVDGLDRLSRNVKTLKKVVVEERLEVIDCELGEGPSYAVVMAKAARAEHEGQLISRNTKKALQKLKELGVPLGNRTNLPEAQKKGGAATKARAQDQVHELAPIIRELRVDGRTTAKAIAEGLNLRGVRTARGEEWNAGNVRRLLERVSEFEKAQEQAKDLENPNWGTW